MDKMQDLKRLGKLNNIYATENEEEGMSLASLVTCNTQNGHLRWGKRQDLTPILLIMALTLLTHEIEVSVTCQRDHDVYIKTRSITDLW